MADTSSNAIAAAATGAAALALSKAAWKLGSFFSNVHQDTRFLHTTFRDLAEELESLGNESNLVNVELERISSGAGTGSPPPDHANRRIWKSLATQVDEATRTVRELEVFVGNIRGGGSNLLFQVQRQREGKDQIAAIRTKVGRHTDNLRNTLLLIDTVRAHIASSRAPFGANGEPGEETQRLSEKNPRSRLSQAGATSTQSTLESVVGGQGAANSNSRVAEWVSTLESLRREQQSSDPSDPSKAVSNVPSVFSGNDAHTFMASATSAQHTVHERESIDTVWNDFDDDLDSDLAKAALDTGTKAFNEQEWDEADCLLQEALRVLQQLPQRQRVICDIFDLQYKLAVCAYHTQEPADAEEALMSLIQQPASTDEQRGYICDAAHLLSLLHVRMGQVDRARSECEKALQARRRLLGKQSDASFESTALMAHIYIMLNNRARAKSCLAMIPEARRDPLVKIVQDSLGTKVGQLDSSSPRTLSFSEDSGLALRRIEGWLSASSLASPVENKCYSPSTTTKFYSPAAGQQLDERSPSSQSSLRALQSSTVTSFALVEERSKSKATGKEKEIEIYPNTLETNGASASSPGKSPDTKEPSKGETFSRKEILNRIGCHPRDRIEEAVCNGDHSAIAKLLTKKNYIWRAKLRKRVRPERVTALHFAALFGETDMASRLLGSGFDINEAPYGYSTNLTPLKFAIGARQVEMVEFLIANGARPSDPDTWSTLAGQLMNYSWLKKTVSEADKAHVATRILAILRILLQHGWDVNKPFDASGRTVLHQAAAFWMGSYSWELSLRADVTLFLCEQGANPFQANKEGKTPCDLASASGHQDLVLILGRGSNKAGGDDKLVEPVELPCELDSKD